MFQGFKRFDALSIQYRKVIIISWQPTSYAPQTLNNSPAVDLYANQKVQYLTLERQKRFPHERRSFDLFYFTLVTTRRTDTQPFSDA